jgi:diguanylate cyclase (GGDEF)-like protein/PAS domain S-box-containing protein
MYLLNRFNFGAKLISGYVILLCLMAIISGVIYISLNRMIESSKWVTHTYEVIRTAESVGSAVLSMEKGHRGFMVAGSNEYLESFVAGQKRFDSLINQGIELASDNPEQGVHWQAAAAIKEEWLAVAANPEIAARDDVIKAEQAQHYFERVSSRTVGKDIFDSIREALMVLEKQFSHSEKIKHLVTSITLDLVNMETGQRGFLLTGKEISLEPYVSGERSLKANSNRLRVLAVAEGESVKEIQAVEYLVDTWISQAANIEIEARRQMNKFHLTIDDIDRMMREEDGQRLIKNLRDTLSKIIREEEGLITLRAQENKDVSDFAIYFSIFGTLIAMVVGTFIALAVTRRILLDEQNSLVLFSAVDSSAAAVMITSILGHVEYVNSSFTQITGYTKKDLMGQKFDLLKSEKANPLEHQKIQKTLDDEGQWQGQMNTVRKDGSSFWSKVALSSVLNKKGRTTHLVGIHDDISKEVLLTEELTFQARHDSLTGLYNRLEFERRIELLLTGTWRENTQYAICFLDLDEFKLVNDNGGHAAGDELLRELGKLFISYVREEDIVARMGGDEFAILLANCSIQAAQSVATKILNGIREYVLDWSDKKFRIGASIGLVAVTSNKLPLSELLNQADTACYLAKQNGKNQIKVYHQNDPDTQRMETEMRMVNRLSAALESNRFSAALESNRFVLYAQSIVPLNSKEKYSYELLLRMISRTGEIISPSDFLPAAERYHIIQSLDKWVVNHSFNLLNANPDFIDAGNTISINLSGQSIADDGMLNFIIKQLQSAKFKPECICFEITETATVSNINRANHFILALREFGCKFALDDFGIGFSSFEYLKKLKVDFLKIDGMFVKNIHNDPINLAMVKSINEIGKVMGMETIAEFVENDDIKNILRGIGVDYAQGYGIDRPAPFLELLSSWKKKHSLAKL